MKRIFDVMLVRNELKAEAFLNEIGDRKPLFVCTIASTDTAKIPGISAAGKYPEFTDYTPPADAELLLLGKCKCIKGVPVTPDGIPTPALITMSALKLADIPVLVACGGLKVKPQIPFLDLGGSPGRDIRTGNAVDNAAEVIERATLAGENLAKTADCLVIGESVIHVHIDRDGDWWIFRQAQSSTVARNVEAHFLSLGADGGAGGGEQDADHVYAYKKSAHTNP